MNADLHPPFDDALTEARLYLTSKAVRKEHLDAFEALLSAVTVTKARRKELVLAWKERMNNIGKLSLDRAQDEATRIATYAEDHPKRVKAFILSWLDNLRGASVECDARIMALETALNRAL